MISRRSLFSLLLIAGSLPVLDRAEAETLPMVTVHKDPSCGCCTAWAEHLRQAGFATASMSIADMAAVKHRLGVPRR